MKTTSRPWRSSVGTLPAGSDRTREVVTTLRTLSARSASAFLTEPVSSPLGSVTRACSASAAMGSPPTIHRPSCAMPMGTTS